MHEPLVPADHLDDFIIVRATAFVSKIQRTMARDVLRKEGLPVLEWRLMFSVARFGSCHLAYITRRTSIDPAHGSRAASALERKGLLTRSDDPDNRRRKILSLTAEGVTLFERIWPQAQQIIRSVTDQLAPDDFSQFKCLLDELNFAAEPLVDGRRPTDSQASSQHEEKANAA